MHSINYSIEKQYGQQINTMFSLDFQNLYKGQQFYLIINSMLQNDDHEEFLEPDYPAFPVVFQRDLQSQFYPPVFQKKAAQKKTPSVPENDANSLFRLTQKTYETKYPQLFNEQIENEKYCLENFFKDYLPINEAFVQQMKKNIDNLNIVRLGANKIYVGEVKNSKCNGKSIILFKNGNLYEGEMVDNKRQGRGAYIHPNLGWYIGGFKDDLKHGQGLEIFYHKSAYKGNFIHGLKHDKGLYIDDQGNIYEGIWKLGIMHGKGVLKTKKSTYTGVFVNWLKHGSGQEHFANGDVYRGQYQNGRFDGIGGYQWKSEGAFYEGNFKNGLRHGKGKWQRGQTKYSGGYSEGLKQGYGELYFPSGNFYKGNFIQDKREGYGQMFWTDTSFYKGQWKNGTQNGKGQIYLAGGDIVSGIFQNSMLVQAMPSIYQKQMEISNLSIQDLFGSKKNLEQTRTRTFSQTKAVNPRKKLARIQQTTAHRHHHHHHKKVAGGMTGNIQGKIYFKSPDKSDHSDGACGTCARRLENFRLKQQSRRVINVVNPNNSSLRQNSRNDEI